MRAFVPGLLALAACAADGRLLGTIAEDARVLVPPVFSLDGRRAAWVERLDGAGRIVHDGTALRVDGAPC